MGRSRKKLRRLCSTENPTQDPDTMVSPDWHGDVLRERAEALKRGESTLYDWSDVKWRLCQVLK